MSSPPSTSPPQENPDPQRASTCDLTSDEAAAELILILDQHLADLKTGRAPSRAELIARHPHLAAQLEACLAGLEFIHGAEATLPGSTQQLGDFRIVREVGRGGMGAIYEAEQISLRRTVALKILRFGSVSDPQAIERFKREAETVAKLHHTNIVPIFAVGVDHGVNYFAMQFIEGRSLAQVAGEAKTKPDARQVAEWGLQAADALAHAHRRGVIHRDVKPSNLLLDRENRLWLTDFGLARKLDDATLSVAGALVGTPRYMSPEQAAAANQRVDHRSDLFSLGSTLYELLTAVPAFRGDTPMEVIQSILKSEPAPIRDYSREAPRDLETIVMKCLAKAPGERYISAEDLATDLRAFLDGRPIRAKRTGIVERTARWVRRQQASVKLAAAVAALTLLATITSLAGWFAYDASRQGSVQLSAVTPPLVVEILDQSDRTVRVETAPMQNPLWLPAGRYQIRASTEGELSETYDLSLRAREAHSFTLDPHDQLLWTARPIERSFDIAPLGGNNALVHWNEQGITLSKRSPVDTVSTPIAAASLPRPEDGPGLRWPWNRSGGDHSGYGAYDLRPWILEQTFDVDGDGERDFVVAARHQAWLAAISGVNGQILWFAPRGHDVRQASPTPTNFPSPPVTSPPVTSTVLSKPFASEDCNGDGISDIVVTMADAGPNFDLNSNQPAVTYWLEAISGKTGRTLWRYDIPAACFALTGNDVVPYDLRWFIGNETGSFGGNLGSAIVGRHRVRYGGWEFERRGPHGYRPASVQAITRGGVARLAIVAGKSFLALDPITGVAERAPIELGIRPGTFCQWGDLDGDGDPDLVMIEALTPTAPTTPASVHMAAWSPTKQKQLWAKTLDAQWPRTSAWSVEPPQWPLVVDLNGDGKSEVVVPDGRSTLSHTGSASGSSVPWGLLTMLDGTTGESRWSKRFVTMDCQVDRMVAGPDIDEDSWRELLVATLEGKDYRIHVDALAGQSGATLWSNMMVPPPETNSSVEYHLTTPQWWQSGNDGWPQLLVQVVEGGYGLRRSIVGTFSAKDGRLSRVGHDITATRPTDMDGDGVEDLLVYNSKTPHALDAGGTLHCLRGVAAERWSQLGGVGEPLIDIDGDGLLDLIAGWPSETLIATSGSTGETLWRIALGDDGRKYEVRSAAGKHGATGDLDGDGVTDLLGWTFVSSSQERGHPFFAVSGKTGKPLWTSKEIASQIVHRVVCAETHDLEGDGELEVVWIASLDYSFPLRASVSTHESQLTMFVTSGRTGKLRFASALSAPQHGLNGAIMQVNLDGGDVSPTVADCDGDGVKDILTPAVLPDGRNLGTVARNGRDGTMLWSRPFPSDPNRQVSLVNWPAPAVCDLDGDGTREVVVVESSSADAGIMPARPQQHVASLEGKSGRELWKSSIETATSFSYSPLASQGELLRPHVLRAGGGAYRIALLAPGNEGKISLFDPQGNRRDYEADSSTSSNGLRVCDANGDGVDELVYFKKQVLVVAPTSDLSNPLWTKPLPWSGLNRILEIVPAHAQAAPAIVVGRDATDNSVVGFDSATGKTIWSVPGVISRDGKDGVYMVPNRIDLLDIAPHETPSVYFSYSSVSRVRRATSAVSTGSETMVERPALTPKVAGPVPQYARQRDDRWKRSLPWIVDSLTVQELAWNLSWILTLSALLIVLPLYVVWQLIRQRSFSLRMLLALPAVVGLMVLAATVRIPIAADVHTLAERTAVAVAFAPTVVALGLFAAWIVDRRWRRVGGWLTATLVVSALFAAVGIWIDARLRDPLLPEEWYGHESWYSIWLIGAHVTTWLLVVILPVEKLIAWVRRKRSFAGKTAVTHPRSEKQLGPTAP